MLTKILLTATLIWMNVAENTFKEQQLKYPRVRQAYKDKQQKMLSLLKEKGVSAEKMQIYLRAFKVEKQLELWAKNQNDTKFIHLKTYAICRTSGLVGPKRKRGDLQIPEGFYHIAKFNPYSNYYLSLGINYPNKSDQILGQKNNLGNDIFIHGACVTIGCLPITDEQIKELYIFCVEAKNNGQNKIPVTIFPARLTQTGFTLLAELYKTDTDKINLWKDLKKGFDIFNHSNRLPSIEFLSNGRHEIQ